MCTPQHFRAENNSTKVVIIRTLFAKSPLVYRYICSKAMTVKAKIISTEISTLTKTKECALHLLYYILLTVLDEWYQTYLKGKKDIKYIIIIHKV